jgi:cobalt-precorrin 5A hydrolase
MMKALRICLGRVKMKITIINVTSLGNAIVDKLKIYLPQCHENFKLEVFNSKDKNFDFKLCCKDAFEESDGIIFISSTGIAVRGIAPYIVSKKSDPAVVVIDSTGKYAISLLSGHLGRANELALKISEILNCEPVITTATDNLSLVAPDVVATKNNLLIDSMTTAKEIASLLVEGKNVGFADEDDIISCPKGYVSFKSEILKRYEQIRSLDWSGNQLSSLQGFVVVTSKNKVSEIFTGEDIPILKLIRKEIILGIGCKKDFTSESMAKAVKGSLIEKNIDLKSIAYIATVDIKKSEPAILSLCEELGAQLKIFTPEEIKQIEHKYEGSDFVRKTIGVGAVCEPVIELSNGEILHKKQSYSGMTLAIGKINHNNFK